MELYTQTVDISLERRLGQIQYRQRRGGLPLLLGAYQPCPRGLDSWAVSLAKNFNGRPINTSRINNWPIIISTSHYNYQLIDCSYDIQGGDIGFAFQAPSYGRLVEGHLLAVPAAEGLVIPR